MKKTLAAFLILLIGILGLNCTAMAASLSLVLITNPDGAVMYDTYDEDIAQPIAIIPEDSVAVRLANVDWGYCVTFGNYAGYIREDDCIRVSPNYYEYELPEGIDYAYYDDDDITDVPEFPYEPIVCYGVDRISTRSGPSGNHTYPGRFPMETDLEVLYQVQNEGVRWCCLELEANNVRYRIYTSMRRIVVDEAVPDDPEEYMWVHITKKHTPRLGPGYEYAVASDAIPPAKVKGFYQQYGWLLYEYTLTSGEIQRAWAPPGYWK